MSRLKGGKLLLDLSKYGDVSDGDISHPLSDEEITSIKEKGLQYNIILNTNEVVIDFIPNVINETTIESTSITDSNGGEWGVVLDIENKVFTIASL